MPRPIRIALAPGSHRGFASSLQCAEAMERGLRSTVRPANILRVPLADGGDGTLEVLKGLIPCTVYRVPVHDPIGRLIDARYLLSQDGSTCFLEMAEASGLRRMLPRERDAWHSSTYGTGELIRYALDQGAPRIVLGIGGSATLDCGAGALSALGVRFLDLDGKLLHPSPSGLCSCARVDLTGIDNRLSERELVLLSDVATPLARSCALYGRQKGIPAADDERYTKVIARMAREVAKRGVNILDEPWLGAGGGLAGGLVGFLHATAKNGAETIGQFASLEEKLRIADVVVTGEGRLDASSFDGKVPVFVARLATLHAIPCVILVHEVEAGVEARLPEGASVFSTVHGDDETTMCSSSVLAEIENLASRVGMHVTTILGLRPI